MTSFVACSRQDGEDSRSILKMEGRRSKLWWSAHGGVDGMGAIVKELCKEAEVRRRNDEVM